MTGPEQLSDLAVDWSNDLAALSALQAERTTLVARITNLQDQLNAAVLQNNAQADEIEGLKAEIIRLEAIIDGMEEPPPPPPPPPPAVTLLGGSMRTRFEPLFRAAVGPTGPAAIVERIFVQTESWGTGKWLDVVAAINAGRVPVVSMKFSHTWGQVADGAEDARIEGIYKGLLPLAPKIKALPLPMFLSGHHEPEGDGIVADFNRMWKHFEAGWMDRLAAIGVETMIITMGGTYAGWTKWTAPLRMVAKVIKRKRWVKVSHDKELGVAAAAVAMTQLEQALDGLRTKKLGADIYEKPGTPYATKMWTSPDDAKSPFRKYFDFCKTRGYTPALPELGVTRRQNDPLGAEQTSFLLALAASKQMEDCLFAVYYDQNVGEGGSTSYTRISQSPASLRALGRSGV